ncbi:MAG: ferritin family protein [Desulfatiglandaceae bacterium]|jgi:rubrerythrin
MFTLGEIIDLAIRIEKNGEEVYRKAQAKTSDTSLASMLQWLADEEVEHEKWFTRFKGEVETTKVDLRLEEMGKRILQGVLGSQAFSIEDVDFSRIEDLNNLLELSIEFEKDTILFFEILGGFIDDDKIAGQLVKIIEEENRHVQLLVQFLQKKKALPGTE